MNIHYDNKEYQNEIYELWQSAFQDPDAFVKYYFQWVYPENQVLVATEGQRVCSMLHLNPYMWYWKGLSHMERLHYIVGVATAEKCRRLGWMAACMRRALQDMEGAGEPFTYLMPAKKEYYEAFQFVTVKEACRWRYADGIWCKQYDMKESNGEIAPIRDSQYLKRLQAELQSEGGDILRWDGSSAYGAYIMDVRNEETVILLEQLWIPNADMKKRLELLTRLVIPELYQRVGVFPIEYQVSQPMMLRVLKLERFVSLLPYTGEDIELMVCVQDTICKGNEGIYSILLSERGNQIKRRTKSELPGGSYMEWGIEQLTEWLLQNSQFAKQVYMMEIV